PRLIRCGARPRLPNQKSPSAVAAAVKKAERVGKIGEPIQADVRHIAGGFDAVKNVFPSQPPVEARDAARVMELDEVMRNISIRGCGKDGPRGSGRRHLDWVAAPQPAKFVQAVDFCTFPGLWMDYKEHFVLTDVVL